MNGWLVILHLVQQYFSHIRTMDGGDNERLYAMESRLRMKTGVVGWCDGAG